MTKNQRIHNLLHGPDACYHSEWDVTDPRDLQPCEFCDEDTHPFMDRPDYFSENIPHSTVVAVIQKAVEKWGYQKINRELEAIARRMGMQDGLTVTVAMTAAPVVITAIAAMIEEGGTDK